MIQTAGYEVSSEHNTLSVVTSVGRQHDGRQHGQVGCGEQETGDEELVVRDSSTGIIAGGSSVSSEALTRGVECAGAEVGVASTISATHSTETLIGVDREQDRD